METRKKIKVLIVDDSPLFREVLSRGLSSDSGIEVVATAKDPYDARDKIIAYEPDVMTCDVEMPRMDGITFIRQLMPQYPIPIVVISSVSGAVFDAMNAGAVDFVTKPNAALGTNRDSFIHELITKIKIASVAKIQHYREETVSYEEEDDQEIDSSKIIAIGASTGGTEAITTVLKMMTVNTPGIVIVQHIPPKFSRMFADRVNDIVPMEVKEAVTGDIVQRGHVLIAPGDRHMKIKRTGGQYRVECITGERVNGHCPSVDVLFESVAKEAGKKAVGVILTGMGSDGAKGLFTMRSTGARTIGQDERSAVVYGMPRVAYNIGAVEKQTSLDNVANVVYSMLKY
jgi:two-component system chemotaxis response regulator CheB